MLEYVFCRCCRYMDEPEELTSVDDTYICGDCYDCYYDNHGCIDTNECCHHALSADRDVVLHLPKE